VATKEMTIRVGVDVGGTFTDLALRDDASGRLVVAKVLSTAPDPAEGVLDGFRLLLERAGVESSEISYFAHASTVASNLVLERNGERTALLTTRGFRDVLYLQRQKRAVQHDLYYDKPVPLVERRDIHEIAERVAADGTIVEPLAEDLVTDVLRRLVDDGVSTVAVVLLHSYANPAHERRIKEIAASATPDLVISLSSEISPKWREYERSSTTVTNAYVLPRVVRYLDSMQQSLRREGMAQPLHVMQCNGGLVLADAAKRVPAAMIESGPAAGALMAGSIGHTCGYDRIIAFDMGGTTAKVSIIKGGEVDVAEDFEIAPLTKLRPGSGLPVSLPAVDLIEIGTGGGSIASVDFGLLRVGPESAGASPGPACYSRGGTAATITDANVVLGYLDPDYFLGGELTLDAAAGRAAIDASVGRGLGLTTAAAAYAVHALANATMATAMRAVSVERGLDPRDFALVAFGGAAPSHVAAIAAELGCTRVVVPPNAGIASALGLLVARIKFEFARTLITALEPENVGKINEIFGELEKHAHAALARSKAGASTLVRRVRMRYVGQGYEITAALPAGKLQEADLPAIRRSFEAEYTRLYEYADTDGRLEIVDWRVSALGPATDPVLGEAGPDSDTSEPQRGSRPAYFASTRDYLDTPVIDRYGLRPSVVIEGPAIVQERESTTIVPPDVTAEVDPFGNLVLTLPEGGHGL
jgi:N-methylhydantoinase A